MTATEKAPVETPDATEPDRPCVHVERLLEYVRNYKLTVTDMSGDPIVHVDCAKCDVEPAVSMPNMRG